MRQVGRRSWTARLITVILAITSIPACGSDSEITTTGLLKDRTIEVDGIDRVYDLYVPDAAAERAVAAPLVILLHANRSSKDDITGESRSVSPYALWRDIADEQGLLLLIPQGVEGKDGHAGWNDCRSDSVGNPEADDVSFLVAAIDHVAHTNGLDSERVFATGTSNGGHMAIRLAEEAPERIAGIAVIAAGMPANSKCRNSDVPVSVLFMAGTADKIAPFDGGAMASERGQILSADASVDYWLDRNGISAAPEVWSFDDINTSDDSTVELASYSTAEGASVRFYRIDGGGHAEPSISAHYRRIFERVVGNQNHDIEMSAEVWSFFDSLTL